jgi:hypothetical protein
VSRAAKGADCKSHRSASNFKTSSEKSVRSGPLPVNRLAGISERAAAHHPTEIGGASPAAGIPAAHAQLSDAAGAANIERQS